MADGAPDLIDAGVACARLIADPKSWINRRVETVEMLSQEETRRRVSVDFTLSLELRATLLTRHGVVVPISVLSLDPPILAANPSRRSRPSADRRLSKGSPCGYAADRPWAAPAVGIHPRSSVDPG